LKTFAVYRLFTTLPVEAIRKWPVADEDNMARRNGFGGIIEAAAIATTSEASLLRGQSA